MTAEIPYEKGLIYTTQEVGSVTSQDLLTLLEKAPKIKGTSSFRLDFLASHGIIPESSASLTVNFNGKKLGMGEISIPHYDESQVRVALKGGKLEKLDLKYPGRYGKEEDLEQGSKALAIAIENLDILKEAGYELGILSFRLSHNIVKVPDQYPGFFSNSYGAKIMLMTEEMVKGNPERKLVLKYTEDLASSKGLRDYKRILDSMSNLRNTV